MILEFLKRYENKSVRLILRNNFVYSYISFKISEDCLIQFKDKYGEIITIEPSYISVVCEIKGENGRS